MSICGKTVEIYYPLFVENPPTRLPHSNIGDISGNYEHISTKFSVISVLTRK